MSSINYPLTELHVHIEGTLEPEMVFNLAQRNKLNLPYKDVSELKNLMKFKNLSEFLNLYYQNTAVLIKEEDFSDLMLAYLQKANSLGVIHAEIFFDPQAHTSRGIKFETVLEGLLDGISRAKAKKLSITSGLIMSFLRDKPVNEAAKLLKNIDKTTDKIIGIGLDSEELNYPPILFENVFKEAKEMGLHLVAHAGEEGSARYVWEAINFLQVERIDHGIKSMEDASLIKFLKEKQLPLTICPLSNLKLKVLSHLSKLPLQKMLEQNLMVTINSDDPAYFGGYLDENFTAISKEFNLTKQNLKQLSINSINASFMPETKKKAILKTLS